LLASIPAIEHLLTGTAHVVRYPAISLINNFYVEALAIYYADFFRGFPAVFFYRNIFATNITEHIRIPGAVMF